MDRKAEEAPIPLLYRRRRQRREAPPGRRRWVRRPRFRDTRSGRTRDVNMPGQGGHLSPACGGTTHRVVHAVVPIINDVVLGSLIGLIALGYTMVYGIMQLINSAHGEIFIVGVFNPEML